MGLASLSLEAVPSSTLTPQEPLVESLRIALQRNTALILNNSPLDKTFLVPLLVKEYVHHLRQNSGSVFVLVGTSTQVWPLRTHFLAHNG